jgi:linoleoyl-CoA desaturase
MSTRANCTPTFAPPGPFARDVAAIVRDHFWRGNRDRFGDAWQWALGLGFLSLGAGTYTWLLAFGSVPGWARAAAIAVSVCCGFMLIVQWGHDASHGSLSRHRWVNRAVVFTTFAILGVDGALWRDRHIRLHHAVANLPGTGIDADSVGLMRLAPDKPWRWWFRLQPVYALGLYAIGHANLAWVEDIRDFRAARANGRREFTGWRALVKFVGGKAMHLALFLLVPWLVLSPTLAGLAAGYVFASALLALCFVFLVVGTHISDIADFPLPDESGQLPHDWATHQVAVSVDWSPTSPLAALLSGGANAHVSHHLFPGYSHRHAALLSRLVAKAAEQHGIPLHVTTFPGMVRAHARHVIAMSKP